MERIDLDLGDFTLRRRSVGLGHADAGLGRCLQPGELVALRDTRTGRHYTGVVADVDVEVDDTWYRIDVGARMSPTEARTWAQPPTTTEGRGPVTPSEILRLLAELRRHRRRSQALADLSQL